MYIVATAILWVFWATVVICFMRHLVFLFLNKLTCPLASELGRTGERTISSWSKVGILAYLPQVYSSPLSGESCHMGSRYKKGNAKNVRDFFYGYERIRAFVNAAVPWFSYLDIVDWIMFSNSLSPITWFHPHTWLLYCPPLLMESSSLSHWCWPWCSDLVWTMEFCKNMWHEQRL